jgi:hypothetical protein
MPIHARFTISVLNPPAFLKTVLTSRTSCLGKDAFATSANTVAANAQPNLSSWVDGRVSVVEPVARFVRRDLTRMIRAFASSQYAGTYLDHGCLHRPQPRFSKVGFLMVTRRSEYLRHSVTFAITLFASILIG